MELHTLCASFHAVTKWLLLRLFFHSCVEFWEAKTSDQWKWCRMVDDVTSKLNKWVMIVICALPLQTWSQVMEQCCKLSDGHLKVPAKFHWVESELLDSRGWCTRLSFILHTKNKTELLFFCLKLFRKALVSLVSSTRVTTQSPELFIHMMHTKHRLKAEMLILSGQEKKSLATIDIFKSLIAVTSQCVKNLLSLHFLLTVWFASLRRRPGLHGQDPPVGHRQRPAHQRRSHHRPAVCSRGEEPRGVAQHHPAALQGLHRHRRRHQVGAFAFIRFRPITAIWASFFFFPLSRHHFWHPHVSPDWNHVR